MNARDICRRFGRAFMRLCPMVMPPPVVSENEVKPRFVARDEDLVKVCANLRKAGAIGIDTEFVRVRTYFPMLGLIQVSDKRHTWLIDPLALSDLSPFSRVLTDRSVLKVMHSCSEDLEVLSYLTGDSPGPIFDTQIAASFLGYGFQSGYQQLARELFGAEMEKTETRSDWLARPLSENQIRYAAMDVACLLPMQRELAGRLRKLGRLSWAEEEFERMRRDAGRDEQPEEYYLRFGGLWQYDRRELAILRDLFAWRERKAMTRDLPRTFIMQDKTLRAVAKHKPVAMRDLSSMEEVKPSFVRRHGKAITRIVRDALRLPEESLPPAVPKPPNPRKVGRMVDKLRPIVSGVAGELGLPPELVARKRSIIDLAESVLRGTDPPLPHELQGWRMEVIGAKLLAALGK